MRMGAASFCVAGAALGAPQAPFAWQGQHLEHLHIDVGGSLATGDANGRRQAQHLEHFRLVLRGRRNTWSTSGSFCLAGTAVGAPFRGLRKSGDE